MSSEEVKATSILSALKNFNPFVDMLDLYLNNEGISPARLAEMIHVTPSTISQWRSGVRFPKADMVYHIAVALSLPFDKGEALIKGWEVANTIRVSLAYLEEAFRNEDYRTVISVGERLFLHKKNVQTN